MKRRFDRIVLTMLSSPFRHRNAQCQEAMASTRIAGNVDLAAMLLRYELKRKTTKVALYHAEEMAY